jgi:hypothetical protein
VLVVVFQPILLFRASAVLPKNIAIIITISNDEVSPRLLLLDSLTMRMTTKMTLCLYATKQEQEQLDRIKQEQKREDCYPVSTRKNNLTRLGDGKLNGFQQLPNQRTRRGRRWMTMMTDDVHYEITWMIRREEAAGRSPSATLSATSKNMNLPTFARGQFCG